MAVYDEEDTNAGPDNTPSSLATKEQEASANPSPDESTSAESNALGLTGDSGRDLAPSIESEAGSQSSKLRNIASHVVKHKKGYAGGGGIIGLILSVFIGGLLPMQLVHVKESITDRYSGIQQNIIGKRRMRIYSRFYFFRNDGEFTGYKSSKGLLFGFLENRKTTRMLSELESKGFGIKADTDPVSGKWTGKFSITNPDGTKINSTDSSVWQRRSALRSAMNETYPERSLLWRNMQTNKMFRRLGLNRSRWWSDNKATRALDDIEARWKSRFKTALNNKLSSIGVNRSSIGDNPTDAEKAAQAEVDRAAQELQNTTERAVSDEASGRSSIDVNADRINPDVPSSFSFGSIGRSLGNVIKITGGFDDACDIKRAINNIVKLSRAAKAIQLANAAIKLLSLADGIKAGQAGTGEAISEAMHMINSVDPETKKGFFASGGWNFISSGKKSKPTYGGTYDVGGGLTGGLATANNLATTVLGGGATVNTTCGTLSKWYVQVTSAGIGIISQIGSFGVVTAIKTGIAATWQVAKQIAIGYGTALGVKLAAGTLVSGTEKGERLGDLLVAGSGVLFGTNGASAGMRPVHKAEYAYQQQQYLAEKQEERSEKSFFARYFDPADAESIAGQAITTLATIRYSPIIKTLASIPSLLLSPFSTKSANAVDEYNCPDAEIIEKDIETDPFCNTIFGNTDAELDKIDPVENLKYMVDGGYVDGNGDPTTTAQGQEYAEYVANCFENTQVSVLFESEGEWASPFTERCYDTGNDAGGIGLHERFRAFRLDSMLLVCAGKTIDTGSCEEESTDSSSAAQINLDIITGDTTNIPCALGTTDLGNAEGYGDGNLVMIKLCEYAGIDVNSQISGNLKSLVDDAAVAGVNLTGGGFRTNEEQWAARVSNCPDPANSSATDCDPDTARAGYSRHQMGWAFDFKNNGVLIACPGGDKSSYCEQSGNNAGFNWLSDNAGTYGLKNFSGEAWHWSIDGS